MNMIPLHFFHIVMVLFFLLPCIHACTPLYDVALSKQRRYLGYQQRGLPRPFVRSFYKKFLQNLMQFSKEKYWNTPLREICLTEQDIGIFFKEFHDESVIDRKIKQFEARFPDLPYLTHSKVQEVPIDNRFERASRKFFNISCTYLEKGDISRAAHLPRTSKVLFDPAQQESFVTYAKHEWHAPKMKASKLIATVTGMVLTLEFMKVERMNSIQILRHTVAWLSTVFRALQDDGPELQVPVLFLAFYEHAFMMLEEHTSFTVPMVSAEVVEEEFGDVLNVYTHVDAWGRLEIIEWKDKGSTWTIEKVLFNKTVLGKIAEKIGFIEFDPTDHPPYDADVESMEGWEMEVDTDDIDPYDDDDLTSVAKQLKDTHDTTRQMDKNKVSKNSNTMNRWRNRSNRMEGMCESPLYEYVPLQVSYWEEGCCASICCNALLMFQSGMTIEECCGDCNQFECSIEGSPLELLAMVHLEPYGSDEGGFVPVSL